MTNPAGASPIRGHHLIVVNRRRIAGPGLGAVPVGWAVALGACQAAAVPVGPRPADERAALSSTPRSSITCAGDGTSTRRGSTITTRSSARARPVDPADDTRAPAPRPSGPTPRPPSTPPLRTSPSRGPYSTAFVLVRVPACGRISVRPADPSNYEILDRAISDRPRQFRSSSIRVHVSHRASTICGPPMPCVLSGVSTSRCRTWPVVGQAAADDFAWPPPTRTIANRPGRFKWKTVELREPIGFPQRTRLSCCAGEHRHGGVDRTRGSICR